MDLQKAKKAEKKGDSCLKTGLFKWNKDIAGAATYYDEAVKIYINACAYDEVRTSTYSQSNMPCF